ncbi:MAG TPA: lipopolysaccharide heptosyltransferase II [Desulfuromonadales bacterium]|nr:lipopolysaccharide heptosyltransferase II [Desulfuromonadales bacterium]
MQPASVRRLLVRSANWIGDAVMTTPAIGSIRRFFPKADITVLANTLVAPIFSPHEWIDDVITFDRLGAHKGVAGRLRLAAELRKRSFDAAIILPNSFDSALVPWLAGIPVRVGRKSDGRGFLLTEAYNRGRGPFPGHEVEYYLALIKHVGIAGGTTQPKLFVTAEEECAADALLARHGMSPDDFILGINPGATYGSAKRWYPDRFAEVARRLAEEWSAKIVIFGGPGETAIAADIDARLGGSALNLAGKTGVRELMALIRRCSFFVTNDSGPMHIAAAFDVPLTAIFGSTDHAGTSPYSKKSIVVRAAVDCSPCKLRECPTDHRCMTSVSVDDVTAASIELLRSISHGATDSNHNE